MHHKYWAITKTHLRYPVAQSQGFMVWQVVEVKSLFLQAVGSAMALSSSPPSKKRVCTAVMGFSCYSWLVGRVLFLSRNDTFPLEFQAATSFLGPQLTNRAIVLVAMLKAMLLLCAFLLPTGLVVPGV